MYIACCGQALTQRLHPIQPTWQLLLVSAPLSLDLHITEYFFVLSMSSIRFFGQAATHLPHALQRSSMTLAIPPTIMMASKGHALMQSPCPRHPYTQALCPP